MRGAVWSRELLEDAQAVSGFPPSLAVYDGSIVGQAYRAIAIVPDPSARFARARGGEFGLDEGPALARAVREASPGTAIVSIVDVPGQAFGAREERAGISFGLAAAVEAYVCERHAGRPLFTLVVGKAISGAFLAHGMQGGWIGALDDRAVEVHVMSAASVARVTRSNAQDVARIAHMVPATARDIGSFASFGAVDERFIVGDAGSPTGPELGAIRAALARARGAGFGLRKPSDRLEAHAARETRALAREVRRRIDETW